MTKEEKIIAVASVSAEQIHILKKLINEGDKDEILKLVIQLKQLEMQKYLIAAIPIPEFRKGTRTLIQKNEGNGEMIIGKDGKLYNTE